jgi:4-hydroxysphinganine ceramide fatty acyl 2-hydroxylase
VPSPRLFESEFFERLSYSTWWHVAVVPAIIILYMFLNVEQWSGADPLSVVILVGLGVLLFTLTEYVLHRFVFHAEWYLPDVRIVRMLHFFLHGIHHMLPNDP